MSEQVQIHRDSERRSEQYEFDGEEADAMREQATLDQEATERRAELDEATETLLDEIDLVLEANAATMVAEYVQQGGE
jgi:ubiquitin-like protein Pup